MNATPAKITSEGYSPLGDRDSVATGRMEAGTKGGGGGREGRVGGGTRGRGKGKRGRGRGKDTRVGWGEKGPEGEGKEKRQGGGQGEGGVLGWIPTTTILIVLLGRPRRSSSPRRALWARGVFASRPSLGLTAGELVRGERECFKWLNYPSHSGREGPVDVLRRRKCAGVGHAWGCIMFCVSRSM